MVSLAFLRSAGNRLPGIFPKAFAASNVLNQYNFGVNNSLCANTNQYYTTMAAASGSTAASVSTTRSLNTSMQTQTHTHRMLHPFLPGQGQQIRNNWQVHLIKGRNKFTGKIAIKGDSKSWFAGANLKADPEAHSLNYYEKPTQKKKRIKNSKIWKGREQAVTNLIKYIKVKRNLEKSAELAENV